MWLRGWVAEYERGHPEGPQSARCALLAGPLSDEPAVLRPLAPWERRALLEHILGVDPVLIAQHAKVSRSGARRVLKHARMRLSAALLVADLLQRAA